MGTKIAVVGSVVWKDVRFMIAALDAFLTEYGPVSLLVSGGADGADTIGERWAGDRDIPTLIHLAKWGEGPQTRTNRRGQTYNPAAGHKRNAYIVRDADVVIAFVTDWAKSRGTKNTVNVHARPANKPVFLWDQATKRWTVNEAAREWVAARRPSQA